MQLVVILTVPGLGIKRSFYLKILRCARWIGISPAPPSLSGSSLHLNLSYWLGGGRISLSRCEMVEWS